MQLPSATADTHFCTLDDPGSIHPDLASPQITIVELELLDPVAQKVTQVVVLVNLLVDCSLPPAVLHNPLALTSDMQVHYLKY